jgi:hypothetical protein
VDEVTIMVGPDGIMHFVHDDQLVELIEAGEAHVVRASNVEPMGVQWIADLSPIGGPALGPFRFRHDALRAEHTWIEENYLASKAVQHLPKVQAGIGVRAEGGRDTRSM